MITAGTMRLKTIWNVKTVLINTTFLIIWSPHDAYFYKGLSELIVDIDRLIYLSLEKIRKDFVFINLNTDSLTEFINRDNEWLSAVKGKQVVLIAARKSEALANYWYYNSNIRGVVYAGLSRDIRKELAYVINGRFLRKDIKKDKITDREMEIIRMTAQGMLPKSIARIENCSVKTVYTHRRNAEAKLYSKLYTPFAFVGSVNSRQVSFKK
ncbi:helix-turn-helix transcriptional regulator [Escherichia coli]|uniref:Helix-turn-helix transcriptional regulator n=2 Tax=Escherichia coli TaxID=562 RepID=A0A8S0G3B4_ECOLX|nr:helix-turn-helix transcriptional regulator [Escherichia coli]